MTNDIIRICLTGELRSGKDAVATLLTVKHGFATPIAFGDSLKEIAHKTFFDVPMTPKPRALYQFMHVMRDYDPDVWIKHVARRVRWAQDKRSTEGIVISDARLPNEIEWARANGFVIVRVKADEATRLARAERAGDAFDSASLTHESEVHVTTFEVDYEIDNNGSYTELQAEVERLVTTLAEK